MLEPFFTHVLRAIDAFPEPTLAIVRNDDFVLEASNGIVGIRFAIESQLEPTILIALLDRSGRVFDVSLLEKVIEPARLARKQQELQRLMSLNESEKRSEVVMSEYARICLDDLVSFIKSNADEFVDFPLRVEGRYRELEREFLKGFGVD
ncbi:hypothetical protein AAHK20_06560 [Trinickia sp. YCB016]